MRCSARGCTQEAVWAIKWRNPTLHGPDRTKVWLACGSHRGFLAEYLSLRDFPVEIVPVAEVDT